MDTTASDHYSGILIAISEACAYVKGARVSLTGREMDVLTAIAISRRPLSTDALLERVWPEQDPERTRLTFKVYVHRLRQRLGSPAAFVCERSLWSLGAGVRVDLLEWKRLTRIQDPLSSQDLAELQRAYEKLSQGAPEAFTRSALIGPVEYLIGQTLFDVGTRLIDESVRCQTFARAISVAREMSEIDPYNGNWHETLLRAHAKLESPRT